MKNSYLTVTDQFCGAGGSSIAATLAGIEVKMAMNHWKLAIKTHNTNFPDVKHDCTDISAVKPSRYPSTDILVTSPECTNHSLAKGKPRNLYTEDLFGNILLDPAEERSRATMWDVPRFAEFHNYNIIVTENVVDAAKWRLWDSWLHAMTALGYDHEVVYFNSMFAHPTPQSRDRLYVVFWKHGNRKPDLDFRPAAHCQACGKTTGAVQTWKKRVKWGRYKAQYFYRCGNCNREVIPFYFAAFNAIDWSIQAPRIGARIELGMKPLKPKTLARIQYGLDKYGRQMMIVSTRYTSGVECRVKNAYDEPTPTQPGDVSHAVVMPWMVETAYSHSGDNRTDSALDALYTQSTRQSVGIVSGFLSKQYGGGADPKAMNLGLDQATGTVTTWDHHALLGVPAPYLIKTVRQNGDDFGVSSLDPARTQTTCQDMGLVAPAFIANNHNTSKAWALDDPLMCVMAGGNHHALLSSNSFLSYYYGQSQASNMTEPVRTMTGLDHASLVSVLDKLTIDDLTFRMLAPHEIGAAMAFPESYVVLGTKREKVRQYGNAVTPPVMQKILERCVASLD